MSRFLLVAFLLPLLASWPADAGGPKQPSNTVELNGHRFTLPAGFTIELVAGPPLVDRPVAIDFDELGRLYVTEVSGAISRESVQQQKKTHRVLRLDAAASDGKFHKRTVFADQLAFPEGVMYYRGSVYVAAPPSIWKLTDTKHSGVADQRVEWFQGKTLTGCANDLHGPYLGPDGMIYWCKGAFAPQTYDIHGKQGWKTRAAHIFRAKPDGSGVEPVMTGGMDNPVDVVFTPGGERIFTTTFLQYPGGGNRDGLIHAVYGGVYGKEFHDVIDPHPWTGPNVLPPLVHLGAAAPCGLHRYDSNAFGKEYRDNIFACCFNMRKVTRHVLVPDGATFKSQDSDFLVSDNYDFHPTDVIEDADGSLLVVDTGGWYKLCCPTSQLVRPEALGGIYRIRKTAMPKVDDPRGLKLAWATMTPSDLVEALRDARSAVRKRAIEALAAKGAHAIEALWPVVYFKHHTVTTCDALWTATRINAPTAREFVRKSLSTTDATVLQVACHSIGLWRDREALPDVIQLLQHKSLSVRRVAAEALGRIGDKTAVPALLAALAEPCDRVLEHSLIYALIEIGDAKATAAGLKSDKDAVRRATLIALDQMANGGLQAKTIAAELASADARMKEAAWWIAGRHPDWGGDVASFLRERLAAKALAPAEQDELVKQLAKFGRGGPVQQLLSDVLGAMSSTKEAKHTVLRAMALAGLKQAPEVWIDGLVPVLAGNDVNLVQEAINTARSWRDPKQRSDRLIAALLRVGNNPQLPVAARLSALAAVPGGLTEVSGAQFDLLRAHLAPEQPVPVRGAAADALGRAKLTKAQLQTLTAELKKAGPMELDRLLEAYNGCTDDAVGHDLLAALQTAASKTSLRPETLKPRLAKFGPAIQKEAAILYAALNVDAAKQQAHLEKLLTTLPAGDVARGRTVFNSEKAACFTCHAIGYRGGNVGPDMTHIAKIRTERDLLESVVFPSASFVRGYEPVTVTTTNGKVFNGVLRKDGVEEIVLATGINQEVRIARADIDEMRPSQVSVMPAGYDQLLTSQELADLLAFLKTCK
jgi:putative membrane-bound dehydrogenase-like protein